VHQLEIKVLDIVDARCIHEVYPIAVDYNRYLIYHY